MSLTKNQLSENHAAQELIIRHKDSVYGQMIRISQNRKNADVDLLRVLLEAHADLPQLGPVEGYREWLVKTTRICLSFFLDDNPPCLISSSQRITKQKQE